MEPWGGVVSARVCEQKRARARGVEGDTRLLLALRSPPPAGFTPQRD